MIANFHERGKNDEFVLYEYIIKQCGSFCKYKNMVRSSEKMPPYPDIFTDDFQMSDQVSGPSIIMSTSYLRIH